VMKVGSRVASVVSGALVVLIIISFRFSETKLWSQTF